MRQLTMANRRFDAASAAPDHQQSDPLAPPAGRRRSCWRAPRAHAREMSAIKVNAE